MLALSPGGDLTSNVGQGDLPTLKRNNHISASQPTLRSSNRRFNTTDGVYHGLSPPSSAASISRVKDKRHKTNPEMTWTGRTLASLPSPPNGSKHQIPNGSVGKRTQLARDYGFSAERPLQKGSKEPRPGSKASSKEPTIQEVLNRPDCTNWQRRALAQISKNIVRPRSPGTPAGLGGGMLPSLSQSSLTTTILDNSADANGEVDEVGRHLHRYLPPVLANDWIKAHPGVSAWSENQPQDVKKYRRNIGQPDRSFTATSSTSSSPSKSKMLHQDHQQQPPQRHHNHLHSSLAAQGGGTQVVLHPPPHSEGPFQALDLDLSGNFPSPTAPTVPTTTSNISSNTISPPSPSPSPSSASALASALSRCSAGASPTLPSLSPSARGGGLVSLGPSPRSSPRSVLSRGPAQVSRLAAALASLPVDDWEKPGSVISDDEKLIESREKVGQTPTGASRELALNLASMVARASSNSRASSKSVIGASPYESEEDDDEGVDLDEDALHEITALCTARRRGLKGPEQHTTIEMIELERVLARLRAGDTAAFMDLDKRRVRSAFLRFKVPMSYDVHKEDCVTLLQHLGHLRVEQKVVEEVAAEISDYASMDYTEFLSFLKKYDDREQLKFKEIFDKFAGENAELDPEGVVGYLTELGYTPMRIAVTEAYEHVDINCDGRLQWDEVLLLMKLYRHTEGFSRKEVRGLEVAFEAALARGDDLGPSLPGLDSMTMPAENLKGFLISYFGPPYVRHAYALAEEVRERAQGICADRSGPPLGIGFAEVLTWARRLREMEFAVHREAFYAADADGSNSIDLQELKVLCSSLGCTLTSDTVDAMIEVAKQRGDWRTKEDGSLDCDGFVHFMQVLHETSGFVGSELEEIKETFVKFDSDNSGDIDVVELCEIIHYLGRQATMAETMALVSKLDQTDDKKRTLDMTGFLHFMRLHRETELQLYKSTFEKVAGEDSYLKRTQARNALRLLSLEGFQPGGSEHGNRRAAAVLDAAGIEHMEIQESIDLDEFVKLADVVRRRRMQELQKRAGFSDAEIDFFMEKFRDKDPQNVGQISVVQVCSLLRELGFPVTSAEDQALVGNQITEARRSSRRPSLLQRPLEVGQADFWSIVHVLRSFYRRDDKQVFDRVTAAAQMTSFSGREVSDFQAIFLDAFERERGLYGPDDPSPRPLANPFGQRGDSNNNNSNGNNNSSSSSFNYDQSILPGAQAHLGDGQTSSRPSSSRPRSPLGGPMGGEEKTCYLSRSAVLRLFRGIGLTMEPKDRAAIEQAMKQFGDDKGRQIDFVAFLKLMRWAVDTDFCGLSHMFGDVAPATSEAEN